MLTNDEIEKMGHIIPLPMTMFMPPVRRNEMFDAVEKKDIHYFDKFSLGNLIIEYNQPQIVFDQGKRILEHCRQLDETLFNKLHKGGIYYWMGFAAFMLRDYQSAVYFMDAAVSEDLRGKKDPYKTETPALKFISLEGEYPHQAARHIVISAQAKVKGVLDFYKSNYALSGSVTNFDLAKLRKKFLLKVDSPVNDHLRTLITTFISFFIEWNDRNELFYLRGDNIHGTAEPFYFHLFKGCVLFESLLKANPKDPLPPLNPRNKPWTLVTALKELHDQLGISHNIRIGDCELPNVIAELDNMDNSIETAIKFCGKIRNTVGHNLGWKIAITREEYQNLFMMVAISNIHAIVCLYDV